MDRRYQVFVSSTFTDLIDERKEVIQALLEMDCLPAGMEMFPAANDDQWTLIEQVISESDYYVVIVGGRYGSTTPEGISFTEKEFDCASSLGKPILGFLHATPDAIPAGKSDRDVEAVERLTAFRDKVKKRLVRTYSSPADLGSAVSRSLIRTFKASPALGWVRGDYAMTPEMIAEVAELKAEVLRLSAELAKAASAEDELPEGDLADGADRYDLRGSVKYYKNADLSKEYNRTKYRKPMIASISWGEIFLDLSPKMVNEASEDEIKDQLDFMLALDARDRLDDFESYDSYSVFPQSVDDVMVQLFALRLVQPGVRKRPVSDQKKYWALTRRGVDRMMRARAIRSAKD